ncbi:unnamed protein product [Phytomonas sp. Hart1]|nr:unnamed protein product [Phytomonas sp. Hart1]|eukprot:CCW71809.1 unnamed protein product [Phytomonas sp. isolate Hart1]
MDDDIPLLRCPLWQSVAELDPQVIEHFKQSMKYTNRFLKVFRTCIDLPMQTLRLAGGKLKEGGVVSPDLHTVLTPNITTAQSLPGAAKPHFYYHLAAMPFRVSPCVCEPGEGDNDPPQMTTGAILAFTDMLTSFHVWFVNCPNPTRHISMSLQCHSCGPLVRGEPYIALSRIDRMGNRIVYTSMEFIKAAWPPRGPPPGSLDTLAKLRAALRECEVVVSAKHTKSIIPSNVLNRDAKTSEKDTVPRAEAGTPAAEANEMALKGN